MAEAPIATWLHLAAGTRPVVTVAFVGTYNRFSLGPEQVRRLHHALGEALGLMDRDGGRTDGKAIKLSQGIEA